MVGLKFDKAKFFFDKQPVIDAIGKVAARNLSKGGSFIRQTARRSMRSRKKPSDPGSPPSAHRQDEDHPHGPLLKDKLFFAFDPVNQSVIIGPEQLNRSQAASIQEHGGKIVTRVPKVTIKRTGKKLSAASLAAIKRKRASGTVKPSPRLVTRTVTVEPRPFMVPAYQKEQPKLAGIWQDTVK